MLILVGITAIMGGEKLLRREYAQSIGFILLMLGLYKISSLWIRPDKDDKDQ